MSCKSPLFLSVQQVALPVTVFKILAFTGIHTAGVTSSKLVLPTKFNQEDGYKSRT
jgi:hypothetical protein